MSSKEHALEEQEQAAGKLFHGDWEERTIKRGPTRPARRGLGTVQARSAARSGPAGLDRLQLVADRPARLRLRSAGGEAVSWEAWSWCSKWLSGSLGLVGMGRQSRTDLVFGDWTMMSGSKDDADTASSNVAPSTPDSAHTGQGAPTDEAHQNAGDGSLTGSIPAGLTVDELMEQANNNKPSDGGTG